MSQADGPNRVIVFESPHRRTCMESRLVLESANIRSEAFRRMGVWQLVVRHEDADRAIAELESYRDEANGDSAPVQRPVTVFGGAPVGVLFYAATIVSVALLEQVGAYGWPWLEIGRLSAGDVMAGQAWRIVTALTLHVDGTHLVSNLVFGGVFGFLAGRILGGGFAWLTIVAAGALGNAINAWARDADHLSIGASTAVFAMLGIMVAHAMQPRLTNTDSAMRRWSPLIAGLMMLALMGTEGERTDVGAHVAGFVAGLSLGWIGSRLPHAWLESENAQVVAGIVAGGIVIAAWVAGIRWSV